MSTIQNNIIPNKRLQAPLLNGIIKYEVNIMSVKDRLKELRQAARLSQADVHELTGISQSQISKFEKGMVLPSIDAVILLAQALKVSPLEIVRDDFCLTDDEITSHNASSEVNTKHQQQVTVPKKEIDETNQLMQAALKLNMAIKELGHKLTSKEIETLDSMLGLCHETLLQEAKKASESAQAKTA